MEVPFLIPKSWQSVLSQYAKEANYPSLNAMLIELLAESTTFQGKNGWKAVLKRGGIS